MVHLHVPSTLEEKVQPGAPGLEIMLIRQASGTEPVQGVSPVSIKQPQSRLFHGLIARAISNHNLLGGP